MFGGDDCTCDQCMRNLPCIDCAGTGEVWIDGNTVEDCETCDGTGYVG